jgi:hypothetical protein
MHHNDCLILKHAWWPICARPAACMLPPVNLLDVPCQLLCGDLAVKGASHSSRFGTSTCSWHFGTQPQALHSPPRAQVPMALVLRLLHAVFVCLYSSG